MRSRADERRRNGGRNANLHARDIDWFSIRINLPRPEVITNQSDVLSPGTAGRSYCGGYLSLVEDGGVSGTRAVGPG
jgi:hypothetical protein